MARALYLNPVDYARRKSDYLCGVRPFVLQQGGTCIRKELCTFDPYQKGLSI